MAKNYSISRREFIKVSSIIGSGFAIGFNMAFASKDKKLGFSPDTFINVLKDDSVVLSVAKAEMGQGVWTSLPMLIAEEMEVDWSKVKVQQIADDNFMGTGGSMSISGYGWDKMRKSGAIAKQMLIEAAALDWKVSPVECEAKKSLILHKKSGNQATFGSLVEAASRIKIPKKVQLKDPQNFSILGKDMLRTDSQGKVDGSAQFAMDKDIKGMLYAMVERPRYFSSSYDGSNSEDVKNQPGIIDVFRISSGVAIVGNNTWAVIKARKKLKVNWKKTKKPINADSDSYLKHMEHLSDGKSSKVRKDGKPSKVFKKSSNIIESEYFLPFQIHAPLEPCNCVVSVSNNFCEIWAGTQNPSNVISRASNVTGISKKNIKLNMTFLGGGFGRKSFNDWIEDGVQISNHLQKPIKLIYTREDDIKHGFARPSSKHKMSAVLENKNIKAWKHVVISPDPLTGNAVNQYGASLPILKWATSIGIVKNKVRNYLITDGAAHIPYKFDNIWVKAAPFETDIPLGFWRAVFNSQNAFANECFIDELAHELGIDPLELRLKNLNNNSRASGVIKKVAKESNWSLKLESNHYQGFAYHHSFGSHVAQIAEISVEKNNKIKVHKVNCVVDCGQTINPMTIRAQMQGAIIFGLGATLYSEMTVKGGRVNQSNYDDYPVVRLDETPEINVSIMNSKRSPGGVGEPGLPPIAPAIANAVFLATGKRVKKLPIKPQDLEV